jgi:hypothetical protein
MALVSAIQLIDLFVFGLAVVNFASRNWSARSRARLGLATLRAVSNGTPIGKNIHCPASASLNQSKAPVTNNLVYDQSIRRRRQTTALTQR